MNPIDTYTKDGTMVLLKIRGGSNEFQLEDNSKDYWTIGFNSAYIWIFTGWDWCHDQIVEVKTTEEPLGWLPLPEV